MTKKVQLKSAYGVNNSQDEIQKLSSPKPAKKVEILEKRVPSPERSFLNFPEADNNSYDEYNHESTSILTASKVTETMNKELQAWH